MFGKRGPEIIDYTLLEKKGFIKKRAEPARKIEVSRDGYVKLNGGDIDELLNGQKSGNSDSNYNSAKTGYSSEISFENRKPNSDLLDSSSQQSDLAQTQISQGNQNSFSGFFDATLESSQISQGASKAVNEAGLPAFGPEEIREMKNLKVKYEDLEYKFERLAEKFESVASKLLEMEQKLR